MALSEPDKARLEEGKAKARAEFETHWQQWNVTDVARWWFKWCRPEVEEKGEFVCGTNHDRLGQILMDVTGVRRRKLTPVKGLRVD